MSPDEAKMQLKKRLIDIDKTSFIHLFKMN